VHPERQDLLVSINPESLLLEGARRVDEWGLIEKKIPSFDMVFDADWRKLAASDLPLTNEQQTVLQHVDGRRDVSAVIEASGLVEFDVGKALYGLVSAGLVHRVGRNSRMNLQTVPESKELEHRNLGLAFYRTGMHEDALREFQRVLELNKDDTIARFHMGLVLMRQGKWHEAIAALQEAAARPAARASAFHNLAIALERVGKYPEALAALHDATRRGGAMDPRIQTSIGVVSLMTGDAQGADRAFAAAKPLWPQAPDVVWYHYAALSAALLGDLERAEQLLKEGLSHHKRGVACLHNNLAAVLERRGAYDAALSAAEHGLTEDPSLPQLHKNIGDLYFRAGRFDEAFSAFDRAIRADPDLGGDVYEKLGDIRLKRREQDEAARCWTRALEFSPRNTAVRAKLDSLRQSR
jgi:tetratricopeptide (TPR) repeat protein